MVKRQMVKWSNRLVDFQLIRQRQKLNSFTFKRCSFFIRFQICVMLRKEFGMEYAPFSTLCHEQKLIREGTKP